jgi:DNA-binding transcriptional LysR family regulator
MSNSSNEMSIFRRVVERGSFAGAAEDMGLSPSAVSKFITRLELRLGVRLINRTTRRLALTHEGEIYLERSRDILGAIESVEAEIASARVSPRGHLRVHVFPTFAVDHLSATLPNFLARYPRVTLEFLVTNQLVNLIGAANRATHRFNSGRAQDRRSHAGGLRKSEVPRRSRPAHETLRPCAA